MCVKKIGKRIPKEINEKVIQHENLFFSLFACQVEEELKAAENLSIQDYIRESQNIASLHHQIVGCDQVRIKN